jgi:hypothetical protein
MKTSLENYAKFLLSMFCFFPLCFLPPFFFGFLVSLPFPVSQSLFFLLFLFLLKGFWSSLSLLGFVELVSTIA